MPLSTNLNVFPFFDDFSANNNYYRILFRPSVPVQARELTQVQTILQDQIEKFGNWAFQNGDIVSGCNIIDMPIVPAVFLSDVNSNGVSYSASALANTQVVSVQTGLSARVMYANSGLAANWPNTNIVYLSYNNTGNNGATAFSNTDTLKFYSLSTSGPTLVATINALANSVANTFTTINAHGIQVSGGVIFINGSFVNVLSPTFGLVNNYGTYAGNNVVGFTLKETIITSDIDSSLLDNALGYSNENAPGADRIQLIPTLTTVSNTITSANGFSPIAVYNYGSLVSKSVQNDVHSIVNDAIAQRIYDEAGNYVVNPPTVDTVTSITGNSIISGGVSANNILARVNPFSGYAQGNYVNRIATSYVNMRRGVDTLTNIDQQISFNYGGYLVLDEVSGSFDFTKASPVYFFANTVQSVTNRTYINTSLPGTPIGNAYMRCFSYNNGTIGSNTAQYLLHIFDINMANGFNTSQIASVYANTGHVGFGDVVSSGVVGASYDDQIYTFGTAGLQNLSPNNINSTQYTYRNKGSYQLNVNGAIVVTLGASQVGGADILPYGANTTLSDLATLNFNIAVAANVQSNTTLSGLTFVSGSNVVLGTATNFVNTFSIGSQIASSNSSGGTIEVRTVTSIANNTYLSVDVPFSNATSNSTVNAVRYFPAGKQLTISSTALDLPSTINTTNTISFTINTGFVPNTSVAVDVTYDVLRTVAYPAKKVINKNRYVKINTATNPNGPWCLGFSDIHQITGIYLTTNGTFTTSGSNVMGQYVFDSGQKDSYYDLGYLYPTSSATIANNISLLVQLDYFSVNTAPGTGFFTVESYPIDDANTANTNAIQTQNIPVYVDGSGNRLYLRDYVDFRTPSVITAVDTGYSNTANATQVTSAIATASLNPSNTLTLAVSNNVNIPSYGKNFQANYTYYLPRKDLVIVSPDSNNGTIKVKEGVSSASPQTPLYPDNAMALAVVNIPAYPSLTTDQLDAIYAVNKTSKNIIRDTSSAITTNIVTNRRYSMADIGKLDTRISDLEYYASLSLLEQTASNMTVTDANGLDRFKNGIFVDPFNDFSYSDISNPEFNIAIDSTNSVARPKVSREVININFNASNSTAVSTGRLVTLPYTPVSFLAQPYATQYRSAALVAFAWNGTCILMPSYDNHIDTINTGSVNITVDNTTAWSQFSNSAYAYIWGDWRTSTNVVSTSSKTVVNTPNPPTQYNSGSTIARSGSNFSGGTNSGYFYNGAAYAYNGDGSVVAGTNDSNPDSVNGAQTGGDSGNG